MKRINKIVSSFLNLLQVASYVSLCACSGNPVKDKCIQTAGDLLPEVKEPENVQNKEVSDKSNESEKNLDKLTNLLTACQSVKKGNNKDKYAEDDKETCSSTNKAKAKNDKKPKEKVKTPRYKRNKSSMSKDSVFNLKTTSILHNLSIDFYADGKLKIHNCAYMVTNEDEFKFFLEYLEKAKEEKKSINGLASIFPKADKERKGNKDSVRLWKTNWFWKTINAHWDLFAELKLPKFSIKSYTDTKKKEKVDKVYIEGLGLTDFCFSDIVNQKEKEVEVRDGKKKKTTQTVIDIKDEYNTVFHIKVDTPKPK